MIEEVVKGVVISVIGGIVLLLLTTITPYLYRKLRYNGTILTGEWGITKTDKHLRREITFKLVQNGYRIHGESSHKLKSVDELNKLKFTEQGGPKMKHYKLKGEVRDGYLYLVCKNKNEDGLGLSVVLLKIIGSGDRMEGWISAYNSSSGDVQGFWCQCVRLNL